jgi:RNA polymerase sigma-70 factor (ECF subfamily)
MNPTESLTDLELLQKISTGDDVAFSQLYSRYNQSVYNFILRLTHQSPAAEDLLQDVFLAIWQGASRFRGKSTVKTWVFRIAYYQTISWLRKNKKNLQLHQNIDDFSITSDESPPESILIEQWRGVQVQSAIEKLSHKHRSVIELTFVHHFTYREIAEIMKCPVGTVKSRMSYALRYLKTELDTKI